MINCGSGVQACRVEPKACGWCRKRLALEVFHRRGRAGRQSVCKKCIAAYQANYYKKTRRRQLRSARLWKLNRQQIVREELEAYSIEHPCVDSGEGDMVVLDFDHVFGRKVANVSKLIQNARPWTQVLLEIRKCQVVCSNCHRRRSARRGKWWSFNRSRARSVNSSIADS
jgi:hypothetical protein